MSKPKFDPTQPYQAVEAPNKPKFDPSQPFDEVAVPVAAQTSDSEALLRGADLDASINAAGSQIGRNIPIVGPATVKAGHAIAAVLGNLTPDDWKKPELRGKTIGELYDQLEEQDKQKQAEIYDKYPIAATAGNIAGGAILPGSGIGAAGLVGVATRVGGNIAINAADTAIRGGSTDDVVESGVVAGGVAAGLEALPYVGKLAKAGKKLIPATEGAVTNKVAAKIASSLPASADASTIEQVYSNPALRRKAVATDFSEEAKNILPKIGEADSSLTKAVGEKFSSLENSSLAGGTIDDVKAFNNVSSDLAAKGKVIADNSKQYGPKVTKIMDAVDHVFSTGGEAEALLPTYKKSIQTVLEEQGEEAAGQVAKLRTLNARRDLDSIVQNSDFEKMTNTERNAIEGIRKDLGKALKESFSGSSERAAADELYQGFRTAKDDLIKPLTFKSGSGARELDAGKIEQSLKTARPIGKRFENQLDQMSQFISKNEEAIGKLPEVENLIAQLGDLRTTGDINRAVGALKTGGGPTGQAVNALSQVVIGSPLAAATGGLSLPIQLALYPITNPAGWIKIVDGLNKAGQGALAQNVSKAANAIIKANPQVATRLYMLSQGQNQ